MGSLNAYEGLDVLLKACAKLVHQGEKIKLLLVGDDQPVTDAVSNEPTLSTATEDASG